MTPLDSLRDLFRHAFWADTLLLDTLLSGIKEVPEEALRELAHVLGAEEVWLSRVEGRTPRAEVWPDVDADRMKELAVQVQDGYAGLLTRLNDDDLGSDISYTNSAGNSFGTSLVDILMHVALHGQYHRGKINLLLRQAGKKPIPTDYIAFVRGVPAATRSRPTSSPDNSV